MYTSIQNATIYFEEIYLVYNIDTNNTITINKNDIKKNIPVNLKTPTKLKLLDKFNDEITQEQFIQLLMFQTSGADFVNIPYVLKYYNLKLDTNGMPMWNQYCAYTDFRYEALQNWFIWNILQTHNTFSKYTSHLLEFTLQTCVEDSIFPRNQNFKHDLHLHNINIIVECNEGHHEKNTQKILDTQKIALNKMNGNILLSVYTNSIVNVENIKQNIYKNLCDNVNGILTQLLQQIYNENNIKDSEIQDIIKVQTIKIIRNYFNKKYTLVSQKGKYNKFKKLDNYSIILLCIKRNIHNYLNIINTTIHDIILDNDYIKCYKSTLLDTILSACLNNFEFRQNYIQVILVENLVDSMSTCVKYLQYLQLLCVNNNIYQDMYNSKLVTFNNLNTISEQFICEPNNFINLFELKIKSLQSINDKVITYSEIIKLLNIKENIMQFKNKVCEICEIHLDICEQNIFVSWKQLQKIIFTYDNKPILKNMLMLYYSEVDIIYENIMKRTQAHSLRLICTPNDYNNYMKRVYNKYTTIIEKNTNKIKTLVSHISGLNTLVNKLSGAILLDHQVLRVEELQEPITTLSIISGFNCIEVSDLEKIAHIKLSERIEIINDSFIKLQNKKNIVSIDTDTDLDDADLD